MTNNEKNKAKPQASKAKGEEAPKVTEPLAVAPPVKLNVISVDESMIDIRKDFNYRSGDIEAAGTPDQADFATLKASILANGQESPVDVVKIGSRFGLICGERRLRAIRALKKTGQHSGQVLATVREAVDSIEERARSIRENVEQLMVKPADLCFAIADLIFQHKKARKAFTQTSLSAKSGLSQPTLSRYMTIIDKVKPSVLGDWRKTRNDVSAASMAKLAGFPKEEQEDRFSKLVGSKADIADQLAPGTDPKVAAKHKRASKMAVLLAELVYYGAIRLECDPDEMSLEHLLVLGVRLVPEKDSDETIAGVKSTFGSSFETATKNLESGVNADGTAPTEPADEDEETE
jgi:hypothetical protein